MKKIKHLFITMLLLNCMIGCKKDNEQPNSANDIYLEYKIDGKLVKINGDLIPVNQSTDVGVIAKRSARGIFVNNFYEISGRNGSSNSIDLNIPVDSLAITSYYLNSVLYAQSTQAGVSLLHNDSSFRLQTNTDFTNITITSYQNGRISGTFSGAMSHYNQLANTYNQRTIADGIFKNVKISY